MHIQKHRLNLFKIYEYAFLLVFPDLKYKVKDIHSIVIDKFIHINIVKTIPLLFIIA
jgi:hypothetical protein